MVLWAGSSLHSILLRWRAPLSPFFGAGTPVGLRLRVYGLGFEVQGFGFKGFWVFGLGPGQNPKQVWLSLAESVAARDTVVFLSPVDRPNLQFEAVKGVRFRVWGMFHTWDPLI